MKKPGKILVTGAGGRLGRYLVAALIKKHGIEKVLATDLKGPNRLDVMDKMALLAMVQQEGVTEIYHLAAMLPAECEQYRETAWNTNVGGLIHVLDAAKIFQAKVFWASSIAVFGANVTRVDCPQHAVTQPSTVYGMTKLAAEQWANYYWRTFGVDTRALRFPGIFAPGGAPRGGMMDMLNAALLAARRGEAYLAYLKPQTTVPAIHIDDAVRASLQLMEAAPEKITIRTAYNLAGFGFSPAALEKELLNRFPDFRMRYQPDSRQQQADGWPESLDDNCARKDWNWLPQRDTLHGLDLYQAGTA